MCGSTDRRAITCPHCSRRLYLATPPASQTVTGVKGHFPRRITTVTLNSVHISFRTRFVPVGLPSEPESPFRQHRKSLQSQSPLHELPSSFFCIGCLFQPQCTLVGRSHQIIDWPTVQVPRDANTLLGLETHAEILANKASGRVDVYTEGK